MVWVTANEWWRTTIMFLKVMFLWFFSHLSDQKPNHKIPTYLPQFKFIVIVWRFLWKDHQYTIFTKKYMVTYLQRWYGLLQSSLVCPLVSLRDRLWIKYYKLIHKICQNHPPWLETNLKTFEKSTSLVALKIGFWRVFPLNP